MSDLAHWQLGVIHDQAKLISKTSFRAFPSGQIELL
jgi:hypothetical protein